MTCYSSKKPVAAGDGRYIALQAGALLSCTADELDSNSNQLTGQVRNVLFQGESLKVKVVLADRTGISFRVPSHHYSKTVLTMMARTWHCVRTKRTSHLSCPARLSSRRHLTRLGAR